MLYDSEYNHLFEGEVNVEPSDFEEEEKKMDEEKTFGERFKEFLENHPYLFLAGCAATGWLLGTFLKGIATKNYNRGYNKGVIDGWDKFYQVHSLMFDDNIERSTTEIAKIVSKAS